MKKANIENGKNISGTMITVSNFCHINSGEKVADVLRNSLKDSYIKPEIGLCPAGGSFNLVVSSGYVFTGDDGEAMDDQEKALQGFILAVFAFELGR